jgi:transposase
MLTIAGNARIFISNTPTCMRQSFEGLSLLVEQLFPGELLSGALFVFLNRSCNRMKIMLWDSDGFIDRREFLMLFEGIEPKKIRSRFAIKKS